MFDDFFSDYELFANDVANANHKFIANALQRWLAVLDGNDFVAKQIEPLESSMDFEKWYADCEATMGGMVASASLTFPLERNKRLGAYLFLMRKAAADEFGAVEIAHTFLTADGHYDANAREFETQIFEPLRRELRVYLERRIRDDSADERQPTLAVPASDRVVPLNHNTPEYAEAIESLNRVRNAVAESNEYDDQSDKSQRLAELDASHTLLSALQVRIDAIRAVMVPCLKYLGGKFVEGAIGVAITTALVALAAILGIHLFM